jgi:hypothetical protein
MVEKLGVPRESVAEQCYGYYVKSGTTLAGLVAAGQKIDYDVRLEPKGRLSAVSLEEHLLRWPRAEPPGRLHVRSRHLPPAAQDWHKFVHHDAIDYSLLKPDPRLRDILLSCDIPKILLTNGDRKHAEMCLERMGLTDCFQVSAARRVVRKGIRPRGSRGSAGDPTRSAPSPATPVCRGSSSLRTS